MFQQIKFLIIWRKIMSKSLRLRSVITVGIIISLFTFMTPSSVRDAGATYTVPGGDGGRTKFGAIAYSKSTGKTGYSYGYNDIQSANQRATNGCGESDCEVNAVFWNGCGALAKGRDGGTAWATAGSRSAAESRALRECNSVDSDCKIICWACSGN
jgi:serine/threonine-protein kinase